MFGEKLISFLFFIHPCASYVITLLLHNKNFMKKYVITVSDKKNSSIINILAALPISTDAELPGHSRKIPPDQGEVVVAQGI